MRQVRLASGGRAVLSCLSLCDFVTLGIKSSRPVNSMYCLCHLDEGAASPRFTF